LELFYKLISCLCKSNYLRCNPYFFVSIKISYSCHG